MANTAQTYLDLITSEHVGQPNFTSMISQLVSPMVQVQTLLESMISIFDLDTPPVGQQLDILGQWIGISRNVSIPITGAYFSWDDTIADGWDVGSWQPFNAPTSITVLPDDAYLNLIKAKIAANNWDGTTEGLYSIISIVFQNLNILIQDHQDMSYAVAIQGQVLDAVTLALLTQGLLIPRPEGVQITEYFVPVDSNELFGWDIESTVIDGWDEGSWTIETPAA